VREQVRWSKSHGEWSIPASLESLVQWPKWLSVPFLKVLIQRPRVDRGTLFFSHIEQFPFDKELFSVLKSFGAVVPLDRHHPLAIVAVGRGNGKTTFCLSWDPALFSESEVEEFEALVLRVLSRGYKEIEDRRNVVEFRPRKVTRR
jgi:hypothetical protein